MQHSVHGVISEMRKSSRLSTIKCLWNLAPSQHLSFAVSRIVQYGADCIFDALKHLLHDNRAGGA